VFKQLQSYAAWRGSVVHDVLATTLFSDLRNRRGVSVERLSAAATDLAARQFAFSSDRRYWEPEQSKSGAGDAYCALAEHEYERPLPDDAVTQVADTARACFERLAVQRDLRQLLERGSDFETELTIDFRLDGVTVSATIDFAFRTAAGRLAIIDWKIAASETSDYTKQLLVYGLAALRSGHWPGLAASDIDLYEANLLRGETRSIRVTERALDDIEDFIYRGVTELRNVHAAAGPDDLSGLSLAGSAMSCAFCNFLRPCLDDLARAGQAEQAPVQGHLLA
jgi:hypothetical protein